ncbi:EpsG family protein [Candidatus Saccharibacteria bacterium]|nr:EpsG family protein [Candidatus Saccharibacteria bacterium]
MEARLSIILSILIIVSNAVLLILGSIGGRKASKNLIWYLSISTVIALAMFAFKINPGVTTDLSRHFSTYYKIKEAGYSAETSIDALVTIKVIFYIITKIGTPRLIAVVSAIISYSTFFFLLSRDTKEKNIKVAILLYSIISFFGLCSNYYIFTGIKTAIAFSLLSLFIYHYNKGNKKIAILFMVLSCFSHSASIIYILLYFVTRGKKNKPWKMAIPLLIMIFYSIAPTLINTTNIPFLSYIFSKIEAYSSSDILSSKLEIYVMDLIYCAFLSYRYFKTAKNCEDEETKRIIDVLKYDSVFILLSSLVSKIMVERGLMLLSFLNHKNIIEEQKEKGHRKTIYMIIDMIYFTVKICYFIVRLLAHTAIY